MITFSQYLTEISSQTLKSIKTDSRPLDGIFGNKSRIVIPLASLRGLEILQKLNSIGVNLDYGSGMVSYEITSQQGKKLKTQKLGSFLNDMASFSEKNSKKTDIQKAACGESFTYWKDLLSWWEKNKVGVNQKDISIVISRNPIDIVRMSDHRDWESCHSPKRDYFHCAIQEAKTGGAIAYAVNTKDLEKVNLEDEEIFEDKEREIEGINPLERLRLRRFTSSVTNDDTEILIPEKRVYGKHIAGFKESVTNWAKSVQKDIIKSEPNFDEFDFRGGSYQDNSASSIWNDFFGTDYSGDKDSIDVDAEEYDSPDEIEARAQRLIEGHTYKYWTVTAELYEYDQPHLFITGSCCFDFDRDRFVKLPEENDLRTYTMYGSSGAKTKTTFGTELKHELQLSNLSEEIYMNVDDTRVRFCIDCRPEGNDLNDLEHFLDDCDEYDKSYNEYRGIIWDLLISSGFVGKPAEKVYKNFHPNPDYDSQFDSDELWIGDLGGIRRSFILTSSGNSKEIKNKDLKEPFESIWEGLDSSNIKLFYDDRFQYNNSIFNETNKVYLKFVYLTEHNNLDVMDAHFDKIYKTCVETWKELKKGLQSSQDTPKVIAPTIKIEPKKVEPHLFSHFKEFFYNAK